MKAIMISIKPKWVVKILNKEKTIEVRKGTALYKATKKLIDENGYAEIYVYCSKDLKSGKEALTWLNQKALSKIKTITYLGNEILGKVIFKFRCYKVEEIKYHFGYYDMGEWTESYILEKSCLSAEELDNYLQASKDYDETKVNGVYGYAIHISNLEIFDKPKELGEFKHLVKYRCNNCPYKKIVGHYACMDCKAYISLPLTKAPQNYMFIEVEE